ncbi:Rha family transcriptional regulator [Vibrio parahaemolyticus]|uniref:Rha family transcriptional regulator n=1 Tax=Vibrio parahaemolyticus TaxID=670 RepID=UPI0009930773|nr:Rha family transcriptional regulator [Vibrio parahaemolyticus]OOQ68171.1 hypothetical protein BSR61_20740 [Vibrio parahaemolyticus]
MIIQPLASYGKLGNTFPVAAKSVTGISLLKLPKGANIHVFNDPSELRARLNRGFLLRAIQHIQIMVGWTGALRCAAFLWGGKANPVQFTTLGLASERGDFKNYPKEAIMPSLISLNQVASSLRVENDKAYVTSNDLALTFGKSHKNVLRDIESLECSNDFRKLNFEPSFYSVETGNSAKRQYKNYHITRDGFAFLAMGFTGKKAAQFKEAYINAFNRMEARLSEQLSAPNPIDSIDFFHQRWLVVVEKGQVTDKRLLNPDEYLFNRKQFINFFKEPDVGLSQIDQLMELSKVVNERLIKLVKISGRDNG